MLTSFLDRLGSLVSRHFVVAYFIPVLVFGFLNTLLLGWQVKSFRVWAPSQFEGFKGLYAVPVLIGLSVLAYLMFSVNVYLRQVLEGRRLVPARLLKKLSARERERRGAILARYEEARDEIYAIQHTRPEWRRLIIEASDRGHANPEPNATYNDDSEAAKRLATLSSRRKRAEPLTRADLGEAVTTLCAVLETIDRGGVTADAERLGQAYDEMLELLDYAEVAWNARRLAALNEVQMQFGLEEPRPTRMGNIAAALDSYAQTRYRMNLETFWNRMQPVLQENEKFYGMLLDAKCQLDFLVLSCWLSMVTAAIWLLAMLWLGFSWPLYLIVLLLAPALARLFYQLAVENYLVFADVVKSAVDLFRFQLLKSLHVPQPTGIRQERALWASLQELSTFGKEGLEISYQHEAP